MKKTLLALMLLTSGNAIADDMIIVADNKVEWHNKEAKMVAVGNAKASKGTMELLAEKLEAFYSDVNGKKEISKVFGYDDVVLVSDGAKGYGDTLEYDVAKDEAVLVGKPAKIKTATETIEANDNIYFYPSKKEAFASGGVKAINKEGNTMYADELKAYFKDANNSSMELDKVDIFDNIKIVSKETVVVADKGTYYPNSGEVHLFDNVVIYQGDNKLSGSKAIANLKTGVSKLVAGPRGKVKGSFKAKE